MLKAAFMCPVFVSLTLEAQMVSFGLLGGLPLSSTTSVFSSYGRYGGSSHFQLKRYAVGPVVQLRLPFDLAIEYRRARADDYAGPAPTGNLTQTTVRANIWDVSLLVEKQFHTGRTRPFALAGATLHKRSGSTANETITPTFPNVPQSVYRYSSPDEPLHYGITAGGGIDWKFEFLHVAPQLRYTHWTAVHWVPGSEQVDLLVTIRR